MAQAQLPSAPNKVARPWNLESLLRNCSLPSPAAGNGACSGLWPLEDGQVSAVSSPPDDSSSPPPGLPPRADGWLLDEAFSRRPWRGEGVGRDAGTGAGGPPLRSVRRGSLICCRRWESPDGWFLRLNESSGLAGLLGTSYPGRDLLGIRSEVLYGKAMNPLSE
jgi:hypothetical protein